MKNEKIILPENVELEKVTIEVFKSKDGKGAYFLSEDKARADLSTHKRCDCGEIIEIRDYCQPCASKRSHERYLNMPFEEWDETTPVCIYHSDEYFFSPEDIDDYLENNGLLPEDLELVICEPNYLREIEESYWEDIMPENWDELSDGNKEVAAKLKELNELIRKQPAFSWGQGSKRTTYKP